jgi:2-phospho-L-lactate/phosphoenolpyruvate guanylyltransferase
MDKSPRRAPVHPPIFVHTPSPAMSTHLPTIHTSCTDFALWLVVPVKPFVEGKSRLASVLPPGLRAELSQRWLTHVLTVAHDWGHFAGIAVVSRDVAVLALARALGALPISEMGNGLNDALAQAGAIVQAAGADAILTLPSDLPLLTHADLEGLYALAQKGEGVVVAPSHDGGTNALLLRPPDAIDYVFGLGSAARHLALAAAAGLPRHIYRSATLALDVDHPEDLLLVDR